MHMWWYMICHTHLLLLCIRICDANTFVSRFSRWRSREWGAWGGQDPQDAWSLQVSRCKRALQLTAGLQKETFKIQYPVGLCNRGMTVMRYDSDEEAWRAGGRDSHRPSGPSSLDVLQSLDLSVHQLGSFHLDKWHGISCFFVTVEVTAFVSGAVAFAVAFCTCGCCHCRCCCLCACLHVSVSLNTNITWCMCIHKYSEYIISKIFISIHYIYIYIYKSLDVYVYIYTQ